jgi:hypothetical protein
MRLLSWAALLQALLEASSLHKLTQVATYGSPSPACGRGELRWQFGLTYKLLSLDLK